MKIIKASAEIVCFTSNLETFIEIAGRTCYKSEDRITPDSAFTFIRMLRDQHKHHSVLEHGSISVRFICDRGISHELVRHRIASFSQESTRYCNYSKGKHGGELTFIEPCFWSTPSYCRGQWESVCMIAEQTYMELIERGATPQEARSVLPNSLKTEVVVTANPREWLHIFNMRCSSKAHPQMRELMIPLHQQFAQTWPAIFADLSFT